MSQLGLLSAAQLAERCRHHGEEAICDRCPEKFTTDGFGFPHASHQRYPCGARGDKRFRTRLRICQRCGQPKEWHEWDRARWSLCLACVALEVVARASNPTALVCSTR